MLYLVLLATMGKKGVRSTRGKGETYSETKTAQVIVLMTPTGAKMLNAKVRAYRDREGKRLSRSEYLERFARDLL